MILDATSSLTHQQQDTNPASPRLSSAYHLPSSSSLCISLTSQLLRLLARGSAFWILLSLHVNVQIYMDDLTNALETQFFMSTFSDLHLHSFSNLGIDICNFSPQLSYFLTTTSYASLPTLIPIFILYPNLQDFHSSEPLFLVSPTSLPHSTLGSMIHHVNHSFANVLSSPSFQSCHLKKYH